jgi:uncharacterized membrane protein
MTFRFPIVFSFIMLIGPLLTILTPEHWDTWQRALLAGGLLGLFMYVLIKLGISEKKMSWWLGASIMITAFVLSIYISNIIEQQVSF